MLAVVMIAISQFFVALIVGTLQHDFCAAKNIFDANYFSLQILI
jgi:hypothetical protein